MTVKLHPGNIHTSSRWMTHPEEDSAVLVVTQATASTKTTDTPVYPQEVAMFRMKLISQAAIVACVGMVATGAYAQQQESQRIEVTGSRIKRVDSESASEVMVITSAQIERSGAQTVTELLKSTPVGNSGGFDENAVASYTPGAGGVSLRGLGVQATLVMIDGRRLAPYGFANGGQQTFVDLNSIPLATVERIEILLDGASAVYGSDAMAGVINFIMKKDYKGFTISSKVGMSTYRDAASRNTAVTYGQGSMATDGYNFFGTLSYSGQNPVLSSDRPITSSADFSKYGIADYRSSYAGNVYSNTTGAFIAPLSTCTNVVNDGSALAGRCIYDATHHQNVIADTNRVNFFTAGAVDLGRGTELFGNLGLNHGNYEQTSPSYSTSTYYSTGTLATPYIILPANHPQNTWGKDVRLRYRFDDVDHTTAVKTDTQRGVLGVRNGDVFGWDAEAGLMYSHSKSVVTTNGLLRDSVLANGVIDPATGKASTSFIFGNPSANNAALLAALYPTLKDQGTTSVISVDAHASREIFELPGGKASLAIGAEARKEKFTSTPDPLTAAGELSVLGASGSDGSRTASAAYAELSMPILKSLEANAAVRIDHYSDFGSATTPKVGLKWKLLPNLALRSTYAEGFRAPSLTETSSTPTTGFYSGIRDPKLCPDPTQSATNTNCDLSVKAVSGSNPDLKPEKSKSVTVGMLFDPSDSFSIAVDAFRIKRRDEISSIDPDYLLAHEADYPGFVTRDASGVIQQLNLVYTNLGSTTVWGYDVDVKSTINLGEGGKVMLNGTYNYLPHYLVANVKGAKEVDYAWTYLQPKERYNASATWEIGPWTSQVMLHYTGSYLRAYTPSDLSCSYAAKTPSLCKVSGWMTADLFFGYKGFKNLDLGLSIQNIESKTAPIDERRATRYTLFNSSYHSQLGRYFQVSAKYTFW